LARFAGTSLPGEEGEAEDEEEEEDSCAAAEVPMSLSKGCTMSCSMCRGAANKSKASSPESSSLPCGVVTAAALGMLPATVADLEAAEEVERARVSQKRSEEGAELSIFVFSPGDLLGIPPLGALPFSETLVLPGRGTDAVEEAAADAEAPLAPVVERTRVSQNRREEEAKLAVFVISLGDPFGIPPLEAFLVWEATASLRNSKLPDSVFIQASNDLGGAGAGAVEEAAADAKAIAAPATGTFVTESRGAKS